MRAVTEFKYLGRVLTNTDDDWPAVAGNIRKARENWGRLARILGREGAEPKVSHIFYTSVTQQVLLFGAESWVLTKNMESALDAFQGRVARRLTGRQPHRERGRKWFYPSLAGDLKEVGVMRARTSVLRIQNTVAQFIVTRPILRLCDVAERRRGTRVPQRWWEQSGIDWSLAREKASAAAEQAGANAAETETPGLGAEADSEPAPRRGGPRAAPGRRCPWESVVPAGRSGAGRRIEPHRTGIEQDNVVPK